MTDTIVQLNKRLKKRRWVVLALIGLMGITVEFVEFAMNDYHVVNEFLVESLIQGITIPVIGYLVFNFFEHAEMAWLIAYNQLQNIGNFNTQLNHSQNWDELIRAILEYPRNVLPVIGTALWIYDRASKRYVLARKWFPIEEGGAAVDIHPALNVCPTCSGTNSCCTSFFIACQTENNKIHSLAENKEVVRYCLPLSYAHRKVAMLQIFTPAGVEITEKQKDLLTLVSPEMTLATDGAQWQRFVILQNNIIETERERITHDLHDVLGQDLAFIRQKLDSLSQSEVAMVEIPRRDLQIILSITDEAYETVRGTLAAIQTVHASSFADVLRDFANAVGTRSGLSINFSDEGVPHELNSTQQRQISLIFREIFHNIEKHARATQISVSLLWEDSDITMVVADDGVGFKTTASLNNDHFGLRSIKRRIFELGGWLDIRSTINVGTEILLKVPYTTPVQGVDPLNWEQLHLSPALIKNE